MKKLIIAIILILISFTVYADTGLTDLQAICEVELRNGKTIEGILLLGRGGWARDYHLNGFYSASAKTAVLFNKKFIAYDFEKGHVYKTPTSYTSGVIWEYEKENIYYLEDTTDENKHKAKYKKDINKNEKGLKTIEWSHSISGEYILKDEIPLYTKLPKGQFVRFPEEKVEPQYIKIKNIKKITLLLKPSEKWVNIIKNTPLADKEMDNYPPVWFHEMMDEHSKKVKYPKFPCPYKQEANFIENRYFGPEFHEDLTYNR